MRNRSVGVAILILLAVASLAHAQTKPEHHSPFWVGAGMAGALGFTSNSESQPLAGTYAYAAFSRIIVGGQGGATIGTRGSSRVAYGMATLAYPARAIRKSLVYPFVGVGGGSLSAAAAGRRNGAVYGAGVGADCVQGDGDFGRLVGIRGGYLYRSDDAGERAIYLTVAVGAGGRRKQHVEPPVIIATRR
jgi:hypothetical protein